MKTLLIDSNYICHRHKFSLEDLSPDEQKSAIIYHFLRDLLFLIKKFKSNRLVFCWDSRESKRREIFPEYKKKRREDLTPQEKLLNRVSYKQFNIIREYILPELGFKNNYMENGYEGDDLIGSIINNNEGDFVVVGNDNDLYALISDRVVLFDKFSKKTHTRESIFEKYGVYPESWEEVKSHSGCKGDEVPGIEGIQIKTAIKYLKGELPEHYKSFQKIVSEEGQHIVAKTNRLIKIPFEGTPNIKLKPFEKLRTKDFLFICGKYEIKDLCNGRNYLAYKNVLC